MTWPAANRKADDHSGATAAVDLAGRMTNRIQVSTDALAAYPDAVERGFGTAVDFGIVVTLSPVAHFATATSKNYTPANTRNF